MTKNTSKLLQVLSDQGGLQQGVAGKVAKEIGVPEAQVYGAGSFYHLLSEPDTKLRICTGLSCSLRGGRALLAQAQGQGLDVKECSCLAACDRAPAVLRDRTVLTEVSSEDVLEGAGDWRGVTGSEMTGSWRGTVGGEPLVMNLEGPMDFHGSAFAKAVSLGADSVIAELERGGLQGRGGAGFPAAIKWRGVRSQSDTERYIVLNADEGEPGTFKDRDLLLRRPDLVIEGLAIAAMALEVTEVYLYLRGEFQGPKEAVARAIAGFAANGEFCHLNFHLHEGHGAYICGEETALLEALEGKRGMPRLKPPFPTEQGLWAKPTLIQNVETIACVPAIVLRGGDWFKALGKTEPGSKLYSISGDVAHPGTYELPLGSSLDELLAVAGGVLGTLQAFSPGGASSGFLPPSERTRALDFKSLAECGSMLGSAGVVVLNQDADLFDAVREQLVFFENESCGQCAPCRIGTRFMREALDGALGGGAAASKQSLQHVAEVAWEMNEGSICGLGQAAALPLTSALKYFAIP